MILVKFPTRGRPDKFLKVLSQYISTQNTEDVHYLITLDADDPSVNDDFIDDIQSLSKHITISVGLSKGKIDACNRGMNIIAEWDIVILASDDMHPQQTGWDKIISDAMQENFPDGDGVLNFSDGFTDLNTMCILGRAYFERFGYIYDPEYISLWCDNAFQDVSRMLNREAKFSQVLFRHNHPANTGNGMDVLYRENDKHFRADQQTYLRQKAVNFGLSDEYIKEHRKA